MSIPSQSNIPKQDMNRQIYRISNFLATKLVYNLRLFCIVIFILLHVTHETYSSPVYVLFVLVVFPLILPGIMKIKKDDNTQILPLLSKKYNYTSAKAVVRSLSFLVETVVLAIWQIGNILHPYQDRFSQYFPLILLISSIGVRILFSFIYYFKLRNELLNNAL